MSEILTRIRLLTITVCVAATILTVKIGSLWNGLDTAFDGSISVATAQAQDPVEAESPPQAAEAPQAPLATEAADADAGKHAGDGDSKDEADPRQMSDQEIEVLQQLSDRRRALDERERETAKRAALLAAAENRLDKKIQDLAALQAKLQGLIDNYDEQQEAKTMSLVKIYENMKPKDAARIFEELDIDTLLLVAERMKERKLAPIMAEMDPTKAKEITVELAQLRQLPELQQPASIGMNDRTSNETGGR